MSDENPPPGRDYALADTVHADTAERMKALGDPVRLHVLDLVLERAMSVSELARHVGRSKGTVAHHVDVLVEAGLLQVVRTRKVRAVEERFYGRTARTIVYPDHGPGSLPFAEQAHAEADVTKMDGGAPTTFTLRHARIPAERAAVWAARLEELALEFIDEPRGGDTEFALYLGLFPTVRGTR